MMQLFIIFCVFSAFLCTASEAVVFQSTHAEIEPTVTPNVSLECRLPDADLKDFYVVSSICILKFQWEVMTWRPVAELRDNEESVQVLESTHASASGKLKQNSRQSGALGAKDVSIGAWNDAFLRVDWELAGNETVGKFRCDVVGFSYDHDVLWKKSSVVELREPKPMAVRDVYNTVIKQKADTESELQEHKREIEDVRELTVNNSRVYKQYVDELEQKIWDLQHMQRVLLTGFLEYWPEGTYGLPMPRGGCPANIGVTWETGYRKHNTESRVRNHDQVSVINHFPEDSLSVVEGRYGSSHKFMYQHFCMTANRSIGPLWPEGSYCIAKSHTCPEGFASGSIFWNDETGQSETSGSLPTGTYMSPGTTIYYCCRSDGPADIPIFLPKTKPFYLYRYNGTCQSIVGMRVREEFMLFDTKDYRQNAYRYRHPDSSLEPDLRIELCYYDKV